MSVKASEMAIIILYAYCIGSIIYHPTSFVLPNAFRAAGDTKFTMTWSIATMFVVRIGLSNILDLYCHMQIYGIWLAMQIDWIVRSIIFVFRFISGKWHDIRVV